jgi:hypothetical protein
MLVMFDKGDLVKSIRRLVLVQTNQEIEEHSISYLEEGEVCLITDVKESSVFVLTVSFVYNDRERKITIPYSYSKSNDFNMSNYFTKI